MNRPLSFDVDSIVLALGVRGAYLRMTGLTNHATAAEFERILSQTTDALLASLSTESIANDPELRGFRLLHDAVKRSNKKNVASPENLLNILLQRRLMPRINVLVDIYNLVSLESRLALGAHDVDKIAGDVHLRLTNGSETFWPLGSSENKGVSAGEYAYIDSSNDIICRLEVRQVEKTKVELHTSDCFYIVQGSSATSSTHLDWTVNRLISLTHSFCGGTADVLYRTDQK